MAQEGHALMNWLTLKGAGARTEETNENGIKEKSVGRQEHKEEERAQAAALHQRYLADVFSYVSRRVANTQEAEDVTAEVFAAAFAALGRRKGPAESYPWLLGIARRKIADFYRHSARQTQILSNDFPARAADLPDAVLTKQERQRSIRELLDTLPEDQREALLLHYVEGLPQAEMAAVLKRSPAAVNSLLQRARAAVYQQGCVYFLNEGEVNR